MNKRFIFLRRRGQSEGSFSNCGIPGPGSSAGIQTPRGVWLGSADALLVEHKAAMLWNTEQLWDEFREIKPPDLERAAADGGGNISGVFRGWYVEGKGRRDWGRKVKNKVVDMDEIFIYPDSRRVSPLSSDSGRGADYSGAAATSYRSPPEVKQAYLLVNFLIRICSKIEYCCSICSEIIFAWSVLEENFSCYTSNVQKRLE